jgi:hypothetical protein
VNDHRWTIHWGVVVLVAIGFLTVVFGWKTLIYVAALFLCIPLFTWIYDIATHSKTCAECLAAQEYVKSNHPEWEVWTSLKSHRAKEPERMIVAVFYQIPGQPARPAPYLLFGVEYGNLVIHELDPEEYDSYRIRNYK